MTVTVPVAVPHALEPFTRGPDGRPRIAHTPAELYAFGSLIRSCEQTLLGLFRDNLVSGTTHTCLGQELCQMAVVRALDDPHDAVWSNHRNHGHFLAYSGDFVGLVAEVMGRAGGACGGMGGSQHLRWRNFHSTGVQGGLTAAGVGHALARKRRAQSGITSIVIGDGTLGEGLVYESLNLASIWNVPVLFVVENNRIAQTTETASTTGGSILARAAAFGLDVRELDDADRGFCGAVEEVVDGVRRGGRPGLLLINTRRLGPHSKGDDFRADEEMAEIRTRDPLEQLASLLPRSERARIDDTNRAFMAEVLAAASASPAARFTARPGSGFAADVAPSRAQHPLPPQFTVRAALNAALDGLLADDERVIVLGEDLHDPYGGAFKVTAGLSTRYPDRVVSTPISEAAIVGAGIGLALAGARPIVEIMFADFVALAVDQLLNQAVKLAGGLSEFPVPLVVRTASGGRRGYGPTHSQSTEMLVAAIPGLTVVSPSHRHDPRALLERAVRDWPYPTVFFEPKTLYGAPVDAGGYEECAADARDAAGRLFPSLQKTSPQPDVLIVTYGAATVVAEAAAERLRAEEIDVGILVVSLLAPLPAHSLAASLLNGCRRIVVLEDTPTAHGFGAEIAALLLERGYQGRFLRIGAPDVPIPAARSLEADVLPGDAYVFEEMSRFLLEG